MFASDFFSVKVKHLMLVMRFLKQLLSPSPEIAGDVVSFGTSD